MTGPDPRPVLCEGDLITVPQALRLLPLPKSSMYELLAAGEIEHARISSAGSRRGRILIFRKSLETYVDRLRLKAARPTPPRVDMDGIIARFGGGKG